jgi:3-isopropylmalate dehydratase small subunit
MLRRSQLVTDCLIGCAMIIARSFARIHETNLKVWYLLFTTPSGMKDIFTETGSSALVVC